MCANPLLALIKTTPMSFSRAGPRGIGAIAERLRSYRNRSPRPGEPH
jgi:hypothetical protein